MIYEMRSYRAMPGRMPDLIKRFNDINTEPVPQDQATPEALRTTLVSEVDRWAPIIKAAGQFAD